MNTQRPLVLLIACLCFACSMAQEESVLTLEQGLNLAQSSDADLLTAQSDVTSAERDLARVQADPLALRLDLLQSEQALAAARDKRISTEIATHIEVADAYAAALEADEALMIAQRQQSIAAQTLEAQRIRLSAGAVTQLDVDKANNDYQAALRSSADAEASRNLAYASLASLLGRDVSQLEAMSEAQLVLPEMTEVMARARMQNAQLQAAARSVAISTARLAAVNNDFSARSEIEAAQDTLNNAQLSLGESQRSLELSIQNSYNSALAAQTRYDSALANYHTAVADLQAQQTRLDSGSISPISYAQAELSFYTTNATLNSAKHALYLSLLRLEQSVVGQ